MKNIRGLIVGSSGTGKTYCLTDIINMLEFPINEFIVFSHTIDSPQNKKKYEDCLNLIESKNKGANFSFSMLNKMPTDRFLYDEENRENFLKNNHSLIVIDDINKKEMNEVIPLFTISRHLNISVLLLYQRFFDIPLTIRINSNLLVIFRCSFGYDTIYQQVKTFFQSQKNKFDRLMNLLNKKEYKHKYILINMDLYDDEIVKIKS